MSRIDVTAPGRELHARFLALGDMTGKTSDEIIAAVGQPSSISSMAAGKMLLQWQATGCHMALLFAPDRRFEAIKHEYAKYSAASTGCMSILAFAFFILTIIGALGLSIF